MVGHRCARDNVALRVVDDRPERLDLTERKAMEYWMKRWGITRDQLTAAHRKVGRLTKDIAAELGKKR